MSMSETSFMLAEHHSLSSDLFWSFRGELVWNGAGPEGVAVDWRVRRRYRKSLRYITCLAQYHEKEATKKLLKHFG